MEKEELQRLLDESATEIIKLSERNSELAREVWELKEKIADLESLFIEEKAKWLD